MRCGACRYSNTYRSFPSLRTRRIKKHEMNQRCSLMPAPSAVPQEFEKYGNLKQETHSESASYNSVLELLSPELQRIWRREKGTRGFGSIQQSRGFPPNRAYIGDFERRQACGEFSVGRNWRRERDWHPTFSRRNSRRWPRDRRLQGADGQEP